MMEQNNKVQSLSSVAIIGCGWLGKALAHSLQSKKVAVVATSSKAENVDKLNAQSIMAQQLTLPADPLQLVEHDVFTKRSLVIAITPQFKRGRTDYADKIAQVVNAAHQRGLVKHIILLSSTAIYNDLAGVVDEESTPNLATEKVQILHAAEQAVLNFSNEGDNQGTVIRLAGLVGPERHPGKFLLANKTLSNASAPVNLIHQKDGVGLIETLLQARYPQGIFNGVSETHVSKQQYYQCAAKSLSLTTPIFTQSNINDITKVVSGEKAKKALNYAFVYPDLLTWL
jgi:nucleoside-diphosphate-sugar epimerase